MANILDIFKKKIQSFNKPVTAKGIGVKFKSTPKRPNLIQTFGRALQKIPDLGAPGPLKNLFTQLPSESIRSYGRTIEKIATPKGRQTILETPQRIRKQGLGLRTLADPGVEAALDISDVIPGIGFIGLGTKAVGKQAVKKGIKALEPLVKEAKKYKTYQEFKNYLKTRPGEENKKFLDELRKASGIRKNAPYDPRNLGMSIEDFYNQAVSNRTKDVHTLLGKSPKAIQPKLPKATEEIRKIDKSQEVITKLEPERPAPPTISKPSVSLGKIKPQKGAVVKMFPRKPQELNVNRLNLNDVQKQRIVDVESRQVREALGDEQVLRIARDAGLDTKTYTIDETAQKIAEQLNVRRNVVSLSNDLEQTTRIADRERIIEEIANMSRLSTTQGTDIARQLAARRIIANELDTPMQRVFKLLENAGVNPKKYAKEATKVNFNDARQVIDFYRKFVPTKFGDWLDAVRYNSMLSSPLTHIVNITSNLAGSSVVSAAEKTLTGTIDLFTSKLTGKSQQYFAREGIEYLKGYVKSIKPAVQRFMDVWADRRSIQNLDLERAPLATKGLKGFTARSLEIPMKALESMDQFFSALIEGGEKAALALRKGKGASIFDIGVEASERARYKLFRQRLGAKNEGALLQAIDFIPKKILEGRRSGNPLVRLISRFTFPFIGTPTNLIKQGVEYSPAGFFTAFGAKLPKEQIAKAIMGTAASLGAATLLASGRLSWAEPRDREERDAFRAAGMQPYAVKIGDNWIGFQKMHPLVSFNLAFIASLDDAIKNQKLGEDWANIIVDSVAKYGNFWADQSYFKSMGDMLAAVKSPDPGQYAKVLANYPQQVVPLRALGGWLARLFDEYQRKTDPDVNFLEKQVQLLLQNIPGLSQKLPARTDLYGEPISAQHRFINALSPFRVTTEDKEKLIQISEAEGALPLYQFLKKMNPEEANKFVDDLEIRKPEVYSRVAKYQAIEEAGLGEAEMQMYGSGVKDGERTKMIIDRLNQFKNKEEANTYLDKLDELKLTNDTIYEQLQKAKDEGKIKFGEEQSMIPPIVGQAFAEESNVLPIFRQPIAVEEESESSEPRDLVASAFPPEELENALAVMQGESGGDPNAINDNTNGSRDWGLFQINDVHAARIKEVFGYDMEELLDPVKNIEVAVWLWREQNWRPWVAAQKLGIV